MRNKENENSKFRKKVVQKEYKVVCQLKKFADIVMEQPSKIKKARH